MKRQFCIYYLDHNYDITNYQQPLKTFYQTQFQMTDSQIRKRMNIFFKKANFITYEGFFFQDESLEESFMFDKMESDFTLDSSDYIFEIMVYSSLETQVMIRRYQNIQEICASLGGIGHVLMFFGLMIVFYEKDFRLTKSIINELYSFPNPNEEKNHEQTKNELISHDNNSSICHNISLAPFKKEENLENFKIKLNLSEIQTIDNTSITQNCLRSKTINRHPSMKSFANLDNNNDLSVNLEKKIDYGSSNINPISLEDLESEENNRKIKMEIPLFKSKKKRTDK